MADFAYGGIEHFTPKQQQFLRRLVDSHNYVAQQSNASPVGTTPAPQGHTAASVKGGGGVIDVAITDTSDQYRGLNHFIDVSPDASFAMFQTVSNGPSTSIRTTVQPGKYYTRSYSQYGTSAPSAFLNHGMVDASGDATPPVQVVDDKVGFGMSPYTTPRPPIR